VHSAMDCTSPFVLYHVLCESSVVIVIVVVSAPSYGLIEFSGL
jgi:hypothetical protein